ncbi:hypothetical protein [Zooshikella ganghwensis]|uniref:Uncharacterized protein n=1 Tax=Zooshikella ganghwensis TaxID=202772 RepID=A0A4P9VUT2_9GAMM|nr:hypothetical protein [Zooshikella ganghwensis]RDH46194.1 hypothetical protein B9G39_23600 [Zooshikella ganghwensis]
MGSHARLQRGYVYLKAATWLEIELLDDDGSPVPHETYNVLLKDGRELTGQLNSQGYAKLEGIPALDVVSVDFPLLEDEWLPQAVAVVGKNTTQV